MKVTILIGAHAYACIEEDGRKTDILLQPGKSASRSLMDYADELYTQAQAKTDLAMLCKQAALMLHLDSPGIPLAPQDPADPQ